MTKRATKTQKENQPEPKPEAASVPAKSVKIKLELELPELDTIASGLLELPGKYTLELLDKLGRAKQAALEILPKGKS